MTLEELIDLLPEKIIISKKKAFLEITSGHVYYCTSHNNRGSLNCVYSNCRGKGNLKLSLEETYLWIKAGIEKGDIKIIDD